MMALPENFPPSAFLANLVQTFWAVERDFSPPRDTFQVLPDSRIELIFSFGSPFLSTAEQVPPLGSCFVVGLLDAPVTLQANGMVKIIGVRFYPWGFYTLLGNLFSQPVSGLCSGVTPLERLASSLEARLCEGVPAVVGELQSFLITCALRSTLREETIVEAATTILAENGKLDLAALAQAMAVSPRTLRRKFQAILGKNPKTLARIARFEFVRDGLWADPDADLSDMALAAGYADQAHMQREFRQFSQQTPRQFAAQMRHLRIASGL